MGKLFSHDSLVFIEITPVFDFDLKFINEKYFCIFYCTENYKNVKG